MAGPVQTIVYSFTTINTTHTTGSFTVTSARPNKRMVVKVNLHRQGASTASTIAVAHNGVSLTSRADAPSAGTPYGRTGIFDLVLGTTQPSGTFVITLSQTSRITVIVEIWEDVQQSGTVASNSSTTLGSLGVTLATSGIVSWALGNNATAAGTFTITGCDQTQISGSPDRQNAGGTGEFNSGAAWAAGSGTLNATWTATTAGRIGHAAVGYTDLPTLSINDGTHASSSDVPTLAAASQLAAADATHASSSDVPALAAASQLAANDATHSHAATTMTLTAYAGGLRRRIIGMMGAFGRMMGR